jgi:hypothetical protein
MILLTHSDDSASVLLQNLQIALTNGFRAFWNTFEALLCLFIISPPSEWLFVDEANASVYPPFAFWDRHATHGPPDLTNFLSALSYAIFGGLHCIAWNFLAYSDVLQWLWRAASLIVAVVPLLVPLLAGLGPVENDAYALAITFLFVALGFFIGPILLVVFVAFIPARIALFVFPFLELSRLPNDAFKAVSWDDVLPHIS